MVIFFTLPPDTVDYPFILVNANRPENGIRYIMNHRRVVKSVIIDSGIEIFRDPRVKDYPGGSFNWIRRQVMLYRKVKAVVPHAEVYATCPDACDDYNPRSLWLSEDFTNIERTVVNVITCVDYFDDIPWLIPVQGWYRSPHSLLYSLEYYRQLGVLDRYIFFAVANLCVEKKCDIIERSVKLVYTWFREHGYRDKRLHVFGLSLRCVDRVASMIHSFDSTAWTRPCNARLHSMHPYSAKNQQQRELFFREWLAQLEKKLDKKSVAGRSLIDYLSR